MRKLVSISLFTIYLLGYTEVSQLVHCPRIFSHYHEHMKANPKLDLLSFLVMHYYTSDGTTADDAEDGQLPFKGFHQPFSATSFLLPYTASLNSNPPHSARQPALLRENNELRNGFIKNLLRPPINI